MSGGSRSGRSPAKTTPSKHGKSRSHHHQHASSTTKSSSSSIPKTRHVEFRSVLRLRRNASSGDRHGSRSGNSCNHVLIPKGTDRNEDGTSSIAILRDPDALSTSKSSSSTHSSSNKSSTLQYGMAMLRSTATAASTSPMRLASSLRSSAKSDIGTDGTDQEEGAVDYHFDAVLHANVTQATLYEVMASSAAIDAVAPLLPSFSSTNKKEETAKDHVLVTLGPSASGKTHTIIGPGGDECSEDEQGIVPRLLRDLFDQYDQSSKKKGREGLSFAVRLSMVHVHSHKVYDMLSTAVGPTNSSKSNGSGDASVATASSVRKMVASMEQNHNGNDMDADDGPEGDIQEIKLVKSSKTGLYRADANVELCREFLEATETLYDGLDEVVVDGETNTIKRGRGHTVITVQPVLLEGGDGAEEEEEAKVVQEGGKITVVDLAVNEPVDYSVSSGRSRGGKNVTTSAVLSCLEAVQQSSRDHGSSGDISYRENKLTMLLQPLFSNGRGAPERSTVITMVVASDQDPKDYSEKKRLLSEVETLCYGEKKGAQENVDDNDGVAMTPSKNSKSSAEQPSTTPKASNMTPDPLATDGKKKKVHHTAAVISTSAALPPTHPPSAKKRENAFGLSERSNSEKNLGGESAAAAASASASIGSKKSSKSTIKTKSPKKGGKIKDKKADESRMTPSKKSAASTSWLDINREAPTSATKKGSAQSSSISSTHQTSATGAQDSSYSKKILGLVDRSPLRHAVGGAKRLRPAPSRDEDDDGSFVDEDERKVTRKLEKDNAHLQDRVVDLEEDREALQRQNHNLEQKCKELMRENANLARMLEEAKREACRNGLQQQAEEEVKKEESERETRINDQSLLTVPFMEHMKSVMQTSDEQMSWQLQDKPHYALNVPRNTAWTCTDLYKHQSHATLGNVLATTMQQKQALNEGEEESRTMDEDKNTNSIVTGFF